MKPKEKGRIRFCWMQPFDHCCLAAWSAERSHPGRKNKYVARMGHPVIVRGWSFCAEGVFSRIAGAAEGAVGRIAGEESAVE
jgi:hypothetical protein